jgi:hypothetical protein
VLLTLMHMHCVKHLRNPLQSNPIQSIRVTHIDAHALCQCVCVGGGWGRRSTTFQL